MSAPRTSPDSPLIQPSFLLTRLLPLGIALAPILLWLALAEYLQWQCEGPAAGEVRCQVTQGSLLARSPREVVLRHPTRAVVSSQRAGRKGPMEYQLDVETKEGPVRLIEPIDGARLQGTADSFNAFLARGGGSGSGQSGPPLALFFVLLAAAVACAIWVATHHDLLWHRQRPPSRG